MVKIFKITAKNAKIMVKRLKNFAPTARFFYPPPPNKNSTYVTVYGGSPFLWRVAQVTYKTLSNLGLHGDLDYWRSPYFVGVTEQRVGDQKPGWIYYKTFLFLCLSTVCVPEVRGQFLPVLVLGCNVYFGNYECKVFKNVRYVFQKIAESSPKANKIDIYLI